MLIAEQPSLSVGMAETIARASLEPNKGVLGGQSPTKGRQHKPSSAGALE
jgi:hypothetical protein